MTQPDAFKAALAAVAAKAAEAAAAPTPEAARPALAALLRELAAALEALPAAAPAAAPAGDPPKPADPAPKPEPSAGRPEEEFFKALAGVHQLLAQGPWPFDPEDYAFLERGPDIWKALPEADRAGERLVKTVASALDRLDALVAHAAWTGDAGPSAALRALRSKGAAVLASRGATAPAEPRPPAPASNPASQELHRLALELGSARLPAERRARAAAAVKQVARYAEEAATADDEKRTVLLRYALNEATPFEAWTGGEGAKRVLALLAKSGLTEILVPLGQTFDESYSPSKYDRRKVSSKEARNTILQVLQRGFLNREGVCIQKAVVAISSGE